MIKATTGRPGLDSVLGGIRLGDNIIWQVDSIEDYQYFVKPFCIAARQQNCRLVYFRFAKHAPLVSESDGAEIHVLDPREGFEHFITSIHKVIEQVGIGGHYVFDSYSALTQDYYSDRMVGNFFILTCPYLYHLETVAYFSILRNYHSYHAIQPMKQTTQLFLDVYRHKNKIYLHPLKVDQRFSPTMFLMHRENGEEFTPITESPATAEVLASSPWPGLPSASYRLIGPWDRRFMHAEEMLQATEQGKGSSQELEQQFSLLRSMVISGDQPILDLAEQYLTHQDMLFIWKRMIGTGMLGGKTVGMLLARAIIRKQAPALYALLEPHDSFFIGSDVFYTYLVYNKCWLMRQQQKNPDKFLEDLDEVRDRIMAGEFPEHILRRFSDLLDYYGQSPIIVRSSSLLEDNFGNAFAGKYESVFCSNQGDHEHRMREFLNAVKTIYASSMSKEALIYRAKREVLESDEQMALLVQRVSGNKYQDLFYPQLGGVAFSYNPYVWNEAIDPEAGMMRLVFGLGTRAVDRADDDYTRVIALNEPDKRPESGFDKVKRYAQRRVDYLDLKTNAFASGYFVDVVKQSPELPIDLFAVLDQDSDTGGSQLQPWVVTFDKLLHDTPFISNMREILGVVKKAYGTHIDVEFSTNFSQDGSYTINLLQCRPLQVNIDIKIKPAAIPHIDESNLIIKAHSGVVGQSRVMTVDRIIYVRPHVYGLLAEEKRYAIARLIGELTHAGGSPAEPLNIMIVGPGRWGTSMPSLGVPVRFSEINTVSVLCEIDMMHEGLVPDLSLGTHFFNEMVEMNMLYLAYFRSNPDNVFNEQLFLSMPNHLTETAPDQAEWTDAVQLIHREDLKGGNRFYLHADAQKQVGVLYLGNE